MLEPGEIRLSHNQNNIFFCDENYVLLVITIDVDYLGFYFKYKSSVRHPIEDLFRVVEEPYLTCLLFNLDDFQEMLANAKACLLEDY